jgi:TonB family protein
MALSIALTIPAVGGASGVDGLAEGVMAQSLERKSPRYPKTQEGRGQEGWVQVSFVISPDGTTQDLLVEDSSGSGQFERAALAAMKRWRYKPATLAGEPVQQCHTRVAMVFALKQEKRGASARFIARFKAATRQGAEGDLESLKSSIDKLAPRNLYEDAYTSYLSAIVAQREHDPDSQLLHLRRVIMNNGEFAPSRPPSQA